VIGMIFLKPFFSCPAVDTRKRRNGFTLIELVVVIALIGIMLFFTIPNFGHLFSDDLRKTSQWILLQVPKYRGRAVSENQPYFLHADMDNHRLWFSSSLMTEEEQDLAMEQGLQLVDEIRILDIIYSEDEYANAGETFIGFYPKGYSDKAILHLENENGDRLSFLFEPFLNQVEMIDGYIGFEK
jgi:prepilin-type N-terminal cleavage/methylation domain-containing protein